MKNRNQAHLPVFSPYFCCLTMTSLCIWQVLISWVKSLGMLYRSAPSSASGDRCDGGFIGHTHTTGDVCLYFLQGTTYICAGCLVDHLNTSMGHHSHCRCSRFII